MLGGVNPEFEAGLKWTSDPATREMVRSYLHHLVILCGAEARASGAVGMRVHWSYPSAFPSWRLEEMQGNWDSITNSCKGLGLALSLAPRMTEGEAVCRYFHRERRARVGENALVTVDVGGGTTDFAIRYQGKLSVQASLLLSARAVGEFMLISDSHAYHEFIKAAELETQWDEFKQLLANTKKGTYVPASMNAVLRRRPDVVQAGILANGGAGRPLHTARSTVLFSLAGIAYYAGVCLRSLRQQNAEAELPWEIWFAGNGSRLIDWVVNRDAALDALGRVFRAGAAPLRLGQGMAAARGLSGLPKQEVAHGLLCETMPVTADLSKSVHLIGETGYSAGSAKLPWNFDLSSEDGETFIKAGSIAVPEQFPELRKFLEAYDSEARRFNMKELGGVVSDGNVRAAVQGRLAAAKAALAEREPASILSPLFIEEVNSVIEDHLLGIRREA
jgi:hypothetical protein